MQECAKFTSDQYLKTGSRLCRDSTGVWTSSSLTSGEFIVQNETTSAGRHEA